MAAADDSRIWTTVTDAPPQHANSNDLPQSLTDDNL